MNFLVSKNQGLIKLYQDLLVENDETLLLPDYADLMWRAKTSGKGLALLDTQAEAFASMQQISDLKRINPNLKVLIIANEITTDDELSALAAGASGTCTSNLLPEKIRQILTTVLDGGVWISSTGLPHLLQRLKRLEELTKTTSKNSVALQQEKISSLTPREREIVGLVANGDCNKTIANKLNIAERTVKAHLSVIFQKLKVNDRLQLALLVNKTQPSEITTSI